ncbi:lytic murein transglycosylase [Devosia sp.]|uniref:lytic murein transglycosylase n=1 Tax=Devosia sp. TaxID=1871048 RepID=UPI002F0DB3EA
MFRVSPRTSPSRRSFLVGSAALLLSAGVAPALARSPQDFVAGLWPAAKARGVSRRAFDAALGDFTPLPKVMDLTRKQPEFTSTVADYIGKRVTDGQAAKGRANRGEWTKTLAAVEARYGVQAEVLLAIWGIETNFGGFMGGTNTVHALATLTHGGYRADYFGGELLTALRIITDGHISPREMVGSWAGAMGHPQFMPSSFTRYAVDFRGEGRADIWNSVPDSLASTANYLKSHGWRAGETWGYEIALPQGFDYAHVWAGMRASLGDWQAAGIVRASGRPFPRPGDVARLYLPMGGHGPAFAALANFDVIKRYNNSDSYALAVGHLADRILGAGGFAAPWPNDTALNADERRRVQERLLARGYQIGTADGVIGPKTRAAVMQFQARAGLLPDGHVSGRLLAALG